MQTRAFRVVTVLAGAVVIAIAVITIKPWADHQRKGQSPLAALVETLSHRPFEGRVWGVYSYRPYRAAMDAASSRQDAVAATVALRKLESIVEVDGTATVAIERIDDAAVLNDVAVAYLVRAQGEGGGHHLIAAVVAADRAHELAPRSTEVTWNRALSVEAVGLVEESLEAWSQYITLDPDSEWTAEARERIEHLRATQRDQAQWSAAEASLRRAVDAGDLATVSAIAARFPLRTYSIVDRQWIPRWGDAAASDEASANKLLHAISAAGTSIARQSGDYLVSDFASAAASGNAAFAAAHARVSSARESIRLRGTEGAIAQLMRVRAELTYVQSPLADTVGVDIAGLLFNTARYSEALNAVDLIERSLVVGRRPVLAARAAWIRGIALTSMGKTTHADGALRHAIDSFRRTHDETFSGALAALIADNAELRGDTSQMWSRHLEAVRTTELYGEADRLLVVLDTFARTALRHGEVHFAEFLNEALLRRSSEERTTPYRCHAFITRCDILGQRGDHAAAADACRTATRLFASIADAAVRDRLATDLDVAMALTSVPRESVATLTRAVEVASGRRDLYRMSRVLLLRAQAYATAGSPELAVEDLDRALQIVEGQRERLEEVRDRIAWFETAEAITREYVRLLVNRGRSDDALQVVERVRARGLLDRLQSARTEGSRGSVGATRCRPDVGEAVVEYWADDDELYVWIVRSDRTHFVREHIERRALAADAARFVSLVKSEDPDLSRMAEVLFKRLIAPADDMLHDVDELTIIPDAAIADVPFPALRDPSVRSYLVTRFATARAPSMTALCVIRANGVIGTSGVLMLGDPRTPQPLPALNTELEAASVRSIAGSVVFDGVDATTAALSSHLQEYRTIHLAVHTWNDEQNGPALALAPEARRPSGLLYANEIEALPLQDGTLVVLAACRSSRGRQLIEGTMSLARAFAAAGAGSVIASLWDTTDDDSGALFTHFYRARAAGQSPACALRTAQLAILQNDGLVSPRHWAAYQVIGGR